MKWQYLALGVLLSFGTPVAVHAETLWDTTNDGTNYVNVWVQQTYGDRALALTWYNGTATGYADTLIAKMRTVLFDAVPVTLKIYDVTGNLESDPLSDAPLVAKSVAVAVDNGTGGATDFPEYAFEFGNTQFSLGRYYAFAFEISQADWELGEDLTVAINAPSYDSTWYHMEYQENDYSDHSTTSLYYDFSENGLNWALAGRLEGNGITDGEYLLTIAPCSTDTRTNKTTSCSRSFQEFVDFSWTINTTQPNRKVEITIRDTQGELINSVAYYYTEPVYTTASTSFALTSSSTEVVASIQTCLVPADEFAMFTPGDKCTTQIFGNGTSTIPYIDWWCEQNYPLCEEGNPLATTTKAKKIYDEMECDEIGILDVKKGVQCAFLWAFEPSTESLTEFKNVRDMVLTTYPLGYATHMVTSVASSFNSTSTSAMDLEFNLHRWFGLSTAGTTTIVFADMTQYMSMVDPIFNIIEILLWLLFALWFITWGLSRKL